MIGWPLPALEEARVRSTWRYTWFACWLGLVIVQGVRGGDRGDEFNQVKREIQQRLHSKYPEDRIEALQRLESYPLSGAVALLQYGLDDPDEKVRLAAYATLLKLNGDEEVCKALLQRARKAEYRKRENQAAVPLLGVLLASELPDVRREASELLDKSAASTKNGLQVVLVLADSLGYHHDAVDVRPLLALSKTQAFARHFSVRRAVVDALTQIADRRAIGALIDIMDKMGGEARADAVEHLATITKQIYGMDAEAWQQWWAEEGETFEYPAQKKHAPYRSVALNTTIGTYYGLPLLAEKVVFVIDTSGSMAGQKIVAAKRELIQAISGLPENVQFDIVAFNGSVTVWQKQLVKATAKMKKAAVAFVYDREARSNTASFDALETALSFDTEAIYFLSDGAPYGGKISDPGEIVATISAINKSRRISIYTIGIGAGLPGSSLDLFLMTLAEQNQGLYRRVDN